MMSLGSFDAFPEVMIGFLLRNKFLMSQNKISAKPLLANDEEGHQERHIDAGEYLKSLVFGGLDGCINTLLIILSGVSSGTKPYEIFILCLCAIVGDGIGMGLGDYLSALAEIKYIKSEEDREFYEVEHLLNDEKKEIIDIYLKKGFTIEDSNRVADLYATNSQAFVNIMML